MQVILAIICLTLWGNVIMSADNQPFTLLHADRTPSQNLLELLKLTHTEHDGTLKDIVTKTQASWLRKPGNERWHMQDIETDQRDQIFSLLDAIGVIKEIEPSKTHYDYFILHGASVERMEKRLTDLLKQRATFTTLVFLTGDRPLDLQAEAKEIADLLFEKTAPKTEYEAARALFNKHASKLLQAQPHVITEQHNQVLYRDKNVIFVDVPMKGTQRPTTADTVALWMKSNPKPGSCLAISNQPYVGYQDAVTRSLLPETFTVETIGTASTEENLAVHLDNIARWLYTELNKR